ncbi:MAG: hypothetical protein U0441_31570 [Polyangiaceae bacterium]
MRIPLMLSLLFAALGLVACAANGDPPNGSNVPCDGTPNHPASGPAVALEARDVAILVVEQTASSLRVTSSARRPRSALGPAASWNGTGAATHTWKLLGPHGEVIASGDIVARGALESPPNESQGAPAVNVPKQDVAFTVKVPQPAPGETIEIAPVGGSSLVARWP